LSKFSILFCFYVEEETAEGTDFEKVGIGWLVGWSHLIMVLKELFLL
jgi:hypothetical protein